MTEILLIMKTGKKARRLEGMKEYVRKLTFTA